MPTLSTRGERAVPGAGTTDPTSIPNNAIFALFGLIGVAFIITGIWFFFWARNGGFHFRQGDWEDYKSTVLRRKGPNGTTLSGATRTTDLGGGSVVGKKYRDSDSSLGVPSEMSDMKSLSASQRGGGRREKEKKKKVRKTRERQHDEEEMAEQPPAEVIRAYRHEKPARVGGINRIPDGSSFEGSTHDSHSDLLSNREKTPTNTPSKKRRNPERIDNYTGGTGTGTGGVRKVNTVSGNANSFWSSAASSNDGAKSERSNDESARIRAEARKLQEKGRAATAGRRDFSYTPGDDARRDRDRVPGSWTEGSEVGSDVTGTKSYHHPIPGLSDYADERRRNRAAGASAAAAATGGYRRGRGARDEMSDSDGN